MFAVKDDVEGPTQIVFADVIDGQAVRAICDGVDYYRVTW